MKKIFCLLIILIQLISVSAYADQHLEISCTIRGAYEDKIITADLYEQAGEIIAVSSLLPDYAVQFAKENNETLSYISTLCLVNPEQVLEIVEIIDNIIRPWIEQQLSDPDYGIYSGELFDNAYILRCAQFPLSKLTEQIMNFTIQGKETDNIILSLLVEYTRYFFKNQDVLLSVQCYDEWKYITVNISDDDHIIMTISADLSDEQIKLLIGYKEDGRYIYRNISIQKEKTSIIIISSYRSGKETSYQSISRQRPLFTEKLTLSNWLKIYELDAESLSEPLIIYGATSNQTNGEVHMGIQAQISGHEKEIISASVNLENLMRNVSYTDKTIIQATNEQQYTVMLLTAASNLQELAAEISPSLPAEYQRLLLKLLYQ